MLFMYWDFKNILGENNHIMYEMVRISSPTHYISVSCHMFTFKNTLDKLNNYEESSCLAIWKRKWPELVQPRKGTEWINYLHHLKNCNCLLICFGLNDLKECFDTSPWKLKQHWIHRNRNIQICNLAIEVDGNITK